MDLKNEKFLKTVGLCAIGLATAAVFPLIAHIGLAVAATYLYSKAPKTKENFFKMGGALLLSMFAGPSVVGLVALAGYGLLTHPLLKQKDKPFYGKPFEQEVVEKVKSMVARR